MRVQNTFVLLFLQGTNSVSPENIALEKVLRIDRFHSIFSQWQLEGITSPCCLLIESHDHFALQFLWWKICYGVHLYAAITQIVCNTGFIAQRQVKRCTQHQACGKLVSTYSTLVANEVPHLSPNSLASSNTNGCCKPFSWTYFKVKSVRRHARKQINSVSS